jgi:amino acid permease
MDQRESQIDVVEDDKKYVVTEGLDEVERQGDIPQPETIRALKGRQMSMIAIGGAIGELGPRWWLAI